MMAGDELHRYLSGVVLLLKGDKKGLTHFDLSTDGFWNSFRAIAVSLPSMFILWITAVQGRNRFLDEESSGVWLTICLAIVDLAVWIVPILIIGALARPLDFTKRFVPLVVASNWSQVIFNWLLVPLVSIRFLLPESAPVIEALMLPVGLAFMFCGWRIVHLVLEKPVGFSIAIYALMMVSSVVTVMIMQSLLGISIRSSDF